MAQQSSTTPVADKKVSLEQLTQAEKTLSELIGRKRQIDKNLANIEVSIFALEGGYLEETTYGNIIKGFDGFIGRNEKKRNRPTDQDRIFSTSSVTYLKALEMRPREQQDGNNGISISSNNHNNNNGDEDKVKRKKHDLLLKKKKNQ